jgi:hypothetical protein
MIKRGERRRLLLSNKAIDTYKRSRAERRLAVASQISVGRFRRDGAAIATTRNWHELNET